MVMFVILAAVMIAGALGVILMRQPVHAALCLVGTLLTLATTYVTLQAHFLAAVQVIVYAGAITVLFLFVIMLLNAQGDERAKRLRWLTPTACIVGALAAGGMVAAAFVSRTPLPSTDVISGALGGGGANALGEVLFSQFVLAFQLVGVLLLTGIIGAVSLVERRAAQEDRARETPQPAARERELTRA